MTPHGDPQAFESEQTIYRLERLGILLSWRKGQARGHAMPDVDAYGHDEACRKIWEAGWIYWGQGEIPLLDYPRCFTEDELTLAYADLDEYFDGPGRIDPKAREEARIEWWYSEGPGKGQERRR